MLELLPARSLRDYQFACVAHTMDAVLPRREGGVCCYYQLPTGTGKTRVAAELISQLTHAVDIVLFVAHKRELIHQSKISLEEDLSHLSIGISMAAEQDICSKQVIVASIQTLDRGRLQQILALYPRVAVLIDECHHAEAGNAYERMIAAVCSHDSQAIIIGCTATPYRMKGDMQALFPLCTFARTIEDMQQAGYLAPTRWVPIHIDATWSDVKKSSSGGETDYNQSELATRLLPSLATIAQKTFPLIGKRPAVVFACDVKQAQLLAEHYSAIHDRAMGGTSQQNLTYPWAMAVWGDMPAKDRAEIINLWKSGRVQTVVNVGLFTEGFDYPNLAAVVIARPTMSPGLYLQMVGRVTRPKSGIFQDAWIIDVCGNSDLTQTKQIVLPKVLEVVSEREEALMEDPSLMDDETRCLLLADSREERDPAKPKKPRQYKILDPLSKSWVAWTKEPGIYVASLGTEKTAILKKDADTGLWGGWLLWPAQEPGKWYRTRVVNGCKPLGELMGHINHVIAQNGIKHLSSKDARWRNEPASFKAIGFLRVLCPEEGIQAHEQGWSKGLVSERINFHKVKHLLEKL